MVTMKNDGRMSIEIKSIVGGGEDLLNLQQAILLGIECIGNREHLAGSEDYQRAIWMLSELLRECMLDASQTHVGLGGRPYKDDLKVTSKQA